MLVPFLPRKHEYVIKVRVSALQEKLYRHFLNTFIFQEGDFSKKGRNDFSLVLSRAVSRNLAKFSH